MFDYIGKRLLITAMGMAAGLLGAKYLAPDQVQPFLDFCIKALGAFVTGQTVSDSVEAWKAKPKETSNV